MICHYGDHAVCGSRTLGCVQRPAASVFVRNMQRTSQRTLSDRGENLARLAFENDHERGTSPRRRQLLRRLCLATLHKRLGKAPSPDATASLSRTSTGRKSATQVVSPITGGLGPCQPLHTGTIRDTMAHSDRRARWFQVAPFQLHVIMRPAIMPFANGACRSDANADFQLVLD